MATRKNTSTASTDFVTVACKLPQGLHIALDGQREHLKLHGSASPYARFGFGMTQVRADVWAQVEEQYDERPGVDHNGRPCTIPRAAWLESGVVFVQGETKSASAEAKDKQQLRAGFEPINPKDPSSGLGIGVLIQPDGEKDPAAV